MSARVVNLLSVGLVAIVVVGGMALYLRAGPRPGVEPSLSPGASVTVAPTDTTAPSESPTAPVTVAPTDSAVPSESPTDSPAMTPSPEPTASPPAGSLEEFLASIAAPVVMEIDGKPEWVVARDGSITRLAPAEDVTFAFYRNGLISIGQPRGEDRSIVRVLDASGQEVASFEVPLLGPDAYVIVTRDRRLAYVMDSHSIFRVDLKTSGVESLNDGMPGFRGEVSPSGNTFASVICPESEDGTAVLETPCQTQVITQNSIVTVQEFNASATTDEHLIGGGWPGISRRWVVYSIRDETRREVPVPEIRIAWGGYAMEDGRFVITGSNDQGEWSMWVFDPVAGTVSPVVLKDIAPRNIVVYDKFLPSTRWAVVGSIAEFSSLGATLHVIDLETGHTVAEVVLGR